MFRPLLVIGLAGIGLAGCATTAPLPPTQVLRYHQEGVAQGTAAIEAPRGESAASLEFQTYADAVSAELARNGYPAPAAGAQPQFLVSVDYHARTAPGPERRSPFSIGIGGGGFSGGRRGGGVGLGGGIGFPIGGSRSTTVVTGELAVQIREAATQRPVWEGRAQGVSDLRSDTGAQAAKLARALFTGFPGQSGRTIEVR